MQKFHMPAIVASDESKIRASWYEAMCRGFELSVEITRANNDVVQMIKVDGGISDLICQRIDAILETPKSGTNASK